jgi:hypothetical protein
VQQQDQRRLRVAKLGVKTRNVDGRGEGSGNAQSKKPSASSHSCARPSIRDDASSVCDWLFVARDLGSGDALDQWKGRGDDPEARDQTDADDDVVVETGRLERFAEL